MTEPLAPTLPTQAPTLRTDRLTLRGHRLDDFADTLSLWSDPVVTRYIGGRPFTDEETWSRLLRYVGHWSLLGFGYWTVRETATDRFVGEVGLADFHRNITPSFDGAPEAGWVLAPWCHGRGFATEAVRAIQAWGDVALPVKRTVCIIGPENVASVKVALKCGFRERERATYKTEPVLFFER